MSDYLDEIRRHAQQAAGAEAGGPAVEAIAQIIVRYTAGRQIQVQIVGTEDELFVRGLFDKARGVLDEHFRQASSRIVRPPG